MSEIHLKCLVSICFDEIEYLKILNWSFNSLAISPNSKHPKWKKPSLTVEEKRNMSDLFIFLLILSYLSKNNHFFNTTNWLLLKASAFCFLRLNICFLRFFHFNFLCVHRCKLDTHTYTHTHMYLVKTFSPKIIWCNRLVFSL